MEQRRILVAVSGGIAAYKVPALVRALRRHGHEVRCVMTPAAVEFVSPLVLQTLSGHTVRSRLFDPAEEGEIDHVALADWADLVVVAPATANLLARTGWPTIWCRPWCWPRGRPCCWLPR
jgi:phosphopantothenoylcysteine decarboxylase/phosphopantothenate--cysteine ligase